MTAPVDPQLPVAFTSNLISRLSTIDGLRLPAYLTRATPYPDQQAITTYLAELLQRDPAVFLERYSSLLNHNELNTFELLRSDYEVDYWLKQAELQADSTPASVSETAGNKGLSSTVKNRRLAQMYKLEQQGEYFSETCMRERQPLIWHHHIGQYEGHPPPPAASGQQQNGLGFADSLLKAQDEVQLRARLQQQLQEQECQLSEHDSDSDEHEQRQDPSLDADVLLHQQASRQGQQQQQQQDQALMKSSVMRQRRQDFLDEMQSRFLSGLDVDSVDYAAIDADVQLDETWAAQQAQDAQDAYFDAD